jgi:hypothetical protein
MSSKTIISGILTLRLRPDTWILQPQNGKSTEIRYTGSYVPVLYGVMYTMQFMPDNDVKLIDGVRIWNKDVHRAFFPLLPYKEEWDPEFYIKKQTIQSLECIKWLRFDIDFHIQTLIPTIPATQYISQVKKEEEGLKKLVYYVGGVDPFALKRAGASKELIIDAYYIDLLLKLCKRYRCIWLRGDNCQCLSVVSETVQDCFSRLFENNVLVQREVDDVLEFTFKWMSLLENDIASAEFTFDEKIPPQTIRAKRVKITTSTGNPYLRMDHMIDKQQLPISFSKKITWKNLPPIQHPQIQSFKQYKKCKDHVHREIQRIKPTTIITFSEDGNENFEAKLYSWTYVHESKLVCVRVCPQNPAMLTVNKEQKPAIEVYETMKYVGRSKWSDLPNLVKYKPDVVVGFFNYKEEVDWCSWLDRFDESVVKILVGTF